ncbi:MAG TPA: type II secretion system F family protein [Thermoflexia bacterium]|jgi:tight adherence protein B|nr:type II secretion system F family protein [Thermoflexia bacterium]
MDLPVLITVLVLALFFGYGVYLFIRGRQSEVEKRLGQYTAPTVEAEAEEAVRAARRSPLGDRLERVLSGRGFAENIRTQLARANLKLTAGEFIAATVISVILFGFLAYFLGHRNPLFGLGGAVLGFFAPRWYVSFLQQRRLNAFNSQLSDTINMLVNGLRAGYSVLQAMEAVAEEMAPPASEEFRRVVREVQLGLSMEEALNNLLRRVPSDDLDLMITAMNVQREVGGNLAEVLDSISFTIRERIRIQGEIRALTAQGRYSGYIVSFLPIVVAVLIYFINPDFIRPLFENRTCGWPILGFAAMGIIIGNIVIRKIVEIEV